MPVRSNDSTRLTGSKAKLFRGLSDESRLAILEALSSGELTVQEIVEQTGLSQSNTSNHLACLRCCGLVKSRQEGRFVRYKVANRYVSQILARAEALLASTGTLIDECSNYRFQGGDSVRRKS